MITVLSSRLFPNILIKINNTNKNNKELMKTALLILLAVIVNYKYFSIKRIKINNSFVFSIIKFLVIY